MATAYSTWSDGVGDGSWGDNGNWDGLVPVSTDDVVCNHSQTSSIITGLDNDAVDLNSLHTTPQYSGDIGISGTPLKIAAGLVWHEGTGTLRYETDTGTTDDFIVDSANIEDAAYVDGDIERLTIMGGHVEALTGYGMAAVASSVFLGVQSHGRGLGAGRNIPSLTMTSPAILKDVSVVRGVLRAETLLAALVIVRGGRVTLTGSASLTTMIVYDGHVDLQGDSTIGTMFHLGGTVDCSKDLELKTFSNLRIFPGAIFIPGKNMQINTGGSILPIPWGDYFV